jgi:hypothetical protein
VDDLELPRVDARLAAEAEGPCERAFGRKPVVVAHVDVHDVERRPDACRNRVDDELRAGVQELEAVGPRLEAELRSEIHGAEQERGDARHARGLVGSAEADRGLDDRDDRRAVRSKRGGGVRVRLRQHDGPRLELAHERQVLGEPLGVRAVDPDDGRPELGDELARRGFAVRRDRVLEVGDDGVGTGLQRGAQLALVAAGREEERAGVCEVERRTPDLT